MSVVTVLNVDDGTAIYQDDKLVFENRNVYIRDLYMYIKPEPFNLRYMHGSDMLNSYVGDIGGFPSRLSHASVIDRSED